MFHIDTIDVQEIREQADYPGLRVRVAVSIGTWKDAVAWDVATGDPIVPSPRRVTLDRILGDPIALLGYAPETSIAEKGVTILERGITSTRWRDYVDIVGLARGGVDPVEFLRSARAVPRHRGLTLEPVAPHLAGYGAVGQAKWAAWRRKQHLESVCGENLEDQVALVASSSIQCSPRALERPKNRGLDLSHIELGASTSHARIIICTWSRTSEAAARRSLISGSFTSKASIGERFSVQSHRRLSSHSRSRVGGASLAELGEQFGVSPNAVRRALVVAGVMMRARGGSKPRR